MVKMKHENAALEILVSPDQVGNAEARGWYILDPDESQEIEIAQPEVSENGES